MKKKKTTINPKNADDKCFQYAVTVALYYEEIKWNPEGVSNINPFINKYNYREINYPSKKKMIGKHLRKITRISWNNSYILKISSSCEKQIILLMISNEEKERWYYLGEKD